MRQGTPGSQNKRERVSARSAITKDGRGVGAQVTQHKSLRMLGILEEWPCLTNRRRIALHVEADRHG